MSQSICYFQALFLSSYCTITVNRLRRIKCISLESLNKNRIEFQHSPFHTLPIDLWWDVCAVGFCKSTKTRETSINYKTENMNKKKMATEQFVVYLFLRLFSVIFAFACPFWCVTYKETSKSVGCNVIFVLRRWKLSDTNTFILSQPLCLSICNFLLKSDTVSCLIHIKIFTLGKIERERGGAQKEQE